MGVLDKVRKFKNSRPKSEGRSRTRGIFHDWQDGSNHIRLVDEFLEVKTHFIAPAPKRGERGLCQGEAFNKDSDDRLPKVINCPDWDIQNEQPKKEKTCSICKLYRIARQALKEDPDADEKKYFEALLSLTRVRTQLKWNVFDREKPNVTVIDDNGNEAKVKGLKIASIGMEAWDDIEGIFEQCGFDITDPDEGIDINVIKGHNGTRTSYSAQAVLEGKGLKVTPFDDEEREIVAKPHDLKAICGKQTDAEKVRDALHGEYADILEMNADTADDDDDDDDGDDSNDSFNVDDDDDTNTDDDDTSSGDGEEDEDALLGGSEKKK